MKKMKFSAIFVIAMSIFVVLFSSCQHAPAKVTTTVTTVTKATMTEPGTNGFLISQKMVVRGNTVWGFSKEAYGTGMQWRDIVAQNPFLQQAGRVYYNETRKMWIVKIHVGEIVRIGNSIITPSCVYEEVTTTTKTTPAPESGFPLLGWLLLGGFILLILYIIIRGRENNSTAVVHVDMRGRGGIDAATHTAILSANVERSYIYREHVANEMLRNPNLTHAQISESSDPNQRFDLWTDYKQTQKGRE